MARIDISNKRFGRLVAINPTKDGKWICECDCGERKEICGTALRKGKTNSCGCLRIELKTKHGMSGTPEYNSWQAMIERCRNKKGIGFLRYGGRGIKVCERWQTFSNFYSDMGNKPSPVHSLERLDVNGNYEPENCVWATPEEQANNRRDNVFMTIGGKKKTFTQWCNYFNMTPNTVRYRIKQGWSFEDAVKTPVDDNRKRY